MLDNHKKTALAVALLAVGLPLTSRTAAGQDRQYSLFFDFGAQGVSVDGDDSKFEEYRDLKEGANLGGLRFDSFSAANPWGLTLWAHDVAQDDEGAGLIVDRPGSVRFRASWDRIPHLYSRNARVLHTIQGGRLDLAAPLRSAIEANPLLIRDVITQAGRPFEIGIRRDIGAAGVDLSLAPSWGFHADVRDEERTGYYRIGTGTYIRRQTVEPGTGAGSFDRERFEPRGFEMPEPFDHRVTDYQLSTSFHRQAGFLDFGWQGSAFQNHVDTLFWDNPFEAPPSVASAADRGRFARGALDLWPDNTWQRLFATGGLNLPGRTRVNLTYAQARFEQDDPFLPFTQNEALFFPGPDNVAGTADDVRGTSLSLLPARSLDGQVDTTRADLRITSRPIDPLTLQAAWRVYEYSDDSRHLVFPGYAAFGESAYRVGIGLRLNGAEALFNEPPSYDRTVWSVGAGWRFGRPARLNVEYKSTEWDYETRQVDSTSEDTLEARLALTPVEWFEARLFWLDASRDFDGPYEIGLETARIRQFDIWTRDRTRYGVDLEFLPGESWTVGLSWYDWQDDYPGVIPEPTPLPAANPFPSFAYGLNKAQNDSLSLTASYAAERWNLVGTLGRDTSEWDSLATPKTTLANDTAQYDPQNRWRRLQDDTVDWASLAFDSQLVPDRLRLLADVNWSSYEGEQKTFNLDTPNINSAVAYPFPPFKTDLFSGNLALRWAVAEHAEIEARYLYEPFRLDDFMWDAVQPYMQGIIEETGGSPNQIRDTDVRRFLFLDGTYSDYTANVYSLAIRLRY